MIGGVIPVGFLIFGKALTLRDASQKKTVRKNGLVECLAVLHIGKLIRLLLVEVKSSDPKVKNSEQMAFRSNSYVVAATFHDHSLADHTLCSTSVLLILPVK